MRLSITLLAALVVLTMVAPGQQAVLRLQPYNGTPGSFLNAQIAADTAANNGILPNRVYELQRGAPYLANAEFRVYGGQTLRLYANDSAGPRPAIYLYPTGTGTSPQNPPGYFVQLYGGDIDMRSVTLTGYFEPIDTNLLNLQGGLIRINTAGAGGSIYIDDCIITNSNGNHIRTDGAPRVIKVTNSVFANMGFLGRSNLGAGKGIDLRDASADSVILQNNTWINWQDRIVRHYNFSNPLAGTGPIGYFKFNHNTLVNGMSYHGLLSLGNMGNRAEITNNLLIDPFSLGNDTDAVRQAEFVNSGELDAFGGARMTWVFTAPNDSTSWAIKNNYYVVTDSGQAFYNAFASAGVTGEGEPLSWHINSRLGADSANAFTKLTGLAMPNTPKVMNRLNRWYRDPNGGNKTKNTPNVAWNLSFDFDRRLWQYFGDTLDCTYPTGSAAYTGALGGFPVGDLNWFPTKLAEWEQSVYTGVGEAPAIPDEFTLSQNFPNPFNPSTMISFGMPVQARVTLEVYDILGKKVATLFDGVKPAGTHEVTFNATRLSTGMYFYRLVTSGQIITKRMVLLK